MTRLSGKPRTYRKAFCLACYVSALTAIEPIGPAQVAINLPSGKKEPLDKANVKDLFFTTEALERDCKLRVQLSSFWNGGVKFRHFVPIYEVVWTSRKKPEGFAGAACVQLFAPTKTLLSLRVEDPKYILAPALRFTNLDWLLSQTNHSMR